MCPRDPRSLSLVSNLRASRVKCLRFGSIHLPQSWQTRLWFAKRVSLKFTVHHSNAIMSTETSPGPSGQSPKRKRSPTPETSQYHNGVDGAALQYAYDEDLGSDPEQAFHTPQEPEHEESPSKRRKHERPTRLNYVPHMTLKGHKRGVAAVKISPDGKWIASCCTSCKGT